MSVTDSSSECADLTFAIRGLAAELSEELGESIDMQPLNRAHASSTLAAKSLRQVLAASCAEPFYGERFDDQAELRHTIKRLFPSIPIAVPLEDLAGVLECVGDDSLRARREGLATRLALTFEDVAAHLTTGQERQDFHAETDQQLQQLQQAKQEPARRFPLTSQASHLAARPLKGNRLCLPPMSARPDHHTDTPTV